MAAQNVLKFASSKSLVPWTGKQRDDDEEEEDAWKMTCWFL
jgi:hypothetical protein